MAPCGRCACPAAGGGATSGVLAACRAHSTGCQQHAASLDCCESDDEILSIGEGAWGLLHALAYAGHMQAHYLTYDHPRYEGCSLIIVISVG